MAEPEPSSQKTSLFEEGSAKVGLDFQHENGADGQWYFPEINGSGVALFDFDNDGDLDVYMLQGAPWKLKEGEKAPLDRLFRNELIPTGKLRLVDITEQSGIVTPEHSMTVAATDFDNDGWTDLYVGSYGANRLWRNRGTASSGPVFEDVTDRFQAADRRWTAALAVFDFDRDGRLDLYVGNYLRFDIARHKTCTVATGQQDYCHPSSYPAAPDLFFHNREIDGQTRFVDFTRGALGKPAPEPTLGLAILDMDDDGLLDVYVAHDDRPNRLWRNQEAESPGASSNGRKEPVFIDEALFTGTAVNGRGDAEASMGVTAGDVDGDGDMDLFMSHLTRQSNTLYINRDGIFSDETRRRGLGAPSLQFTGFGTAFLDADLDGDLDLFVVNGAVQVIESLRSKNDPHPFHQGNQYFENRGDGTFVDATASAGPPLLESATSRGAAVGDLDNDGDPDVVVNNNGGAARLWLNTSHHSVTSRSSVSHSGVSPKAKAPSWLGLRLITPQGRDSLGALARLSLPDGRVLVRRSGTDGSYASSNDPRVLFGLGNLDPAALSRGSAFKLQITWADGLVESFPTPSPGRYTTLKRGTGTSPKVSTNPRNIVDVP